MTAPETKNNVPAWMVGTGTDVDMQGDVTTRMPFRFWLGPGKSRNVVFLTDAENAPVIWEHQYEAMQKGKLSWSNYATCLKSVGEVCPMCQFADAYGKYGRQKVRLFTVLDLTPWTHKRTGVRHEYSRMILAAKSRSSELIMRRYADLLDEGKKLRGATFKVFRSNDSKSPGVGDDYTIKAPFDLSKLPPEDTADFDWNLFAPTMEQLEDAANKCRTRMGVSAAPATISSSARAYGGGEDFDEVSQVEVPY